MYSEIYVDASTQVLKITKPFTSKPYFAAEGYSWAQHDAYSDGLTRMSVNCY